MHKPLPQRMPVLVCATQEALFQLQLSQAEAAARRSTGFVSGKDSAHIGSTPPSAEELANMAAARAAIMAEVEARKQEEAVHRSGITFQVRPERCTVLRLPGIESSQLPRRLMIDCEPTAPQDGRCGVCMWLVDRKETR